MVVVVVVVVVVVGVAGITAAEWVEEDSVVSLSGSSKYAGFNRSTETVSRVMYLSDQRLLQWFLHSIMPDKNVRTGCKVLTDIHLGSVIYSR